MQGRGAARIARVSLWRNPLPRPGRAGGRGRRGAAGPHTRTNSPFASPLICTTVALHSGEVQDKFRASKKRGWSYSEGFGSGLCGVRSSDLTQLLGTAVERAREGSCVCACVRER